MTITKDNDKWWCFSVNEGVNSMLMTFADGSKLGEVVNIDWG